MTVDQLYLQPYRCIASLLVEYLGNPLAQSVEFLKNPITFFPSPIPALFGSWKECYKQSKPPVMWTHNPQKNRASLTGALAGMQPVWG